MGKEKAKRKPYVAAEGDVRERLRRKYPQLTEQGTPWFSRFEFKRMDDEEFKYMCQQDGHIMVNHRTLNYINERCKELGIRKELADGALHIKKVSGTQSK